MNLMNKKKWLSKKLIALNKIKHPLPPSEIRVTWSTHILPPKKEETVDKVDKSRTTSVSNIPNKISHLEKYQNHRTNYYRRHFKCFCFNRIRFNFSKYYTRAEMHSSQK